MQKLTTALVLTALLVTPTLPAGADGGPRIDPWGLTDSEEGEGGPRINPAG